MAETARERRQRLPGINQREVNIEENSTAQARSSRYGTTGTRSRVRNRAVVLLLAAVALGWLVWAALAAANPEARSQILDFRVLDDNRIEATVEVIADGKTTVDCTLRAQNADHVTTGVARVVSPARGAERRVLRAVVKTRDRAVVVTVAGCRRRS